MANERITEDIVRNHFKNDPLFKSIKFDVVAIAVSGQTEQELLVSHFVWKKGGTTFTESTEDKKLLPVNNYLKLFDNEQFADNLRNVDIIQKAIFLNEEYQAYSITEMTRCTMVSAILLSLLDNPFRISYKTYSTSESLGKAMLSAIESVLANNSTFNQSAMIGEYSKILNEPIFKQKTIKHKKKKEHEQSVEVAKEMIDYLHRNVYPLMDMEQSGFDVLGRFYTEFIRYAGSEQSQGLVLTPAHITDLFCDLANVNSNVKAGRSTQATLLNRKEYTYEAIYLSPALLQKVNISTPQLLKKSIKKELPLTITLGAIADNAARE